MPAAPRRAPPPRRPSRVTRTSPTNPTPRATQRARRAAAPPRAAAPARPSAGGDLGTASSSRSRDEARSSASSVRPMPRTTNARSRHRSEDRDGRSERGEARSERRPDVPTERALLPDPRTPKIPAAIAIPGKTSDDRPVERVRRPARARGSAARRRHGGVGGCQEEQRHAVEQNRLGWVVHWAPSMWPRMALRGTLYARLLCKDGPRGLFPRGARRR